MASSVTGFPAFGMPATAVRGQHVVRHKEGLAVIDELILRAGNKGYALDKDLIFDVVESSEKKLFVISADGLRIRECSGALHSASQYHLRRENASRYFISRYCNSFYLSNISTLSLNGIKHWGFFI
ncbi:hypothetical protein [Kosakonia cowanii]|uniref:hypothetical protein n=1 Tax=Kosakonia cowanii TaxID=208223 RepID=UPI003D1967CB